MTLSFDLYWSFRSPYSYMVVPRLQALEAEYNARCVVKPVLPLAVRTPEFFDNRDPLWGRYLLIDVHREAAFLGMPFRWPRPDPVQQQNGSYRIPQPYIHRLTRMGVAAAEAGKGLAFLREASHLIWSGEVDGWHEGDHLARAAERAGLDLDALNATVEREGDRLAAVIEINQTGQREAGHWGVPLMVFGGEPFFGQDRIDQMRWRMRMAALQDRKSQET